MCSECCGLRADRRVWFVCHAFPVYTGVGLNTEINIKDRPVTREGMVGIAPGTMGPGRQVVDASFYVGKLRQKTAELQAEIDKMNAEVERYHKDSTTYQQYERKYETLIKEVRRLEGQLADYNLAMDKSRTSTVSVGTAGAHVVPAAEANIADLSGPTRDPPLLQLSQSTQRARGQGDR